MIRSEASAVSLKIHLEVEIWLFPKPTPYIVLFCDMPYDSIYCRKQMEDILTISTE